MAYIRKSRDDRNGGELVRWVVKKPLRSVMLAMLGAIPILVFSLTVESAEVTPVKKYILIEDAETGKSAGLKQGRKLKITCHYGYGTYIGFLTTPSVQLFLDDKEVGTQTTVGKVVSSGQYGMYYELVTQPFIWEAKILGTHTVQCSIDPISPLASKDTTIQETFVVEASPILQKSDMPVPTAKPQTPVLPPASSAQKWPESAPTLPQQPTQPAVAKPDLIILTANTNITPNCGLGQTVVTLNVEVKNAGLGPAITTPEKPLKLSVDADAGLVDQEVAVGTLNPGQTAAFTVGLKPVGSPKSLGGAKLKLNVAVNPKYTIEESNHSNNAVTMGLSFPSNFCTSSPGEVRGTPTPSPGSRQQGVPSSPKVPAVQKPARPAEQK